MLLKKSFLVASFFAMLAIPTLALAQFEPTYRAIVTGGPTDGLTRLILFNKTLRAELGVSDLALANVGCDQCHELDSGQEEPRRTSAKIALERLHPLT